VETIIDRRIVKPTVGQTRAVLIGSALMLTLSMGMRQSLGLFMLPITRDLHLSVADFTFALAIQNIAWGLSQPFIGAFADKYGCRPVTMAGSVAFALGIFFTMTATGSFGILLGAGVLMGVALSCTASNLAMSACARAVSPQARMMALGAMSAVGSLGTFLAAPFAQTMISSHGWQTALFAFLMFCGIMLPAAFFVGSGDKAAEENARAGGGNSFGESPSLIAVLRDAVHHRGYITMAVAFFVCGLQLVFLTTHLPTYLALCGQDPMLSAEALSTIGMFNVVGCYVLGWAGGRFPKHILLGLVYVLRSLAITAYFLMPPTTTSTLVFSAIMGLLWLGVAPLVNGLVAQMFGLRYMATLTGMAFFVHQLGSFLGAWGGGLIYDALGSYDRAWQFGVIIGVIAGVAQMLASDRPRPRVLRPAMA
jgi:predicted MFS family arabinose efflux permease